MNSNYNFIHEKEASFLKYSEDYLRAVQERVSAFFIAIEEDDVKTKVQEASDLWYQILISEASSFYKLLYEKGFKNEDPNFMKRKGYRNKNRFAFDLITNWVFERSVIPYLHKYSGLDCEPFYLNPETCDTDAQLGWELDVKSNQPRKINSKYDFLTKINDDVHHIELKTMFIYGRKSANFKTYFTPKRDADLSKYHVLFLNFNGLGNPKDCPPDLTIVSLNYIPWTKLKDCHVHYPPQLDGKPCYLVHFPGEVICEKYDVAGYKDTDSIANDNKCFIMDDVKLKKKIRYDDLKPYLNYKNEKFIPENILKVIQNN